MANEVTLQGNAADIGVAAGQLLVTGCTSINPVASGDYVSVSGYHTFLV